MALAKIKLEGNATEDNLEFASKLRYNIPELFLYRHHSFRPSLIDFTRPTTYRFLGLQVLPYYHDWR